MTDAKKKKVKRKKMGKLGKNLLKRHKTCQLDHLAKLGQIIDAFLNFLQAIANAVALVVDLEK